MANRSIRHIHSRALVVAITIGAIATMVFDVAWADKEHPGRVFKDATSTPLKVDVEAWAADERSKNRNGCPQYQDRFYATDSDSNDGTYIVKIPNDERLYNTVYCEIGYHALTYTKNLNDRDGERVIPYTARMMKQSTTPQERKEATQRIGYRTVNLTIFFLNELANLQRIDPDAVRSALREYGKVISLTDRRAEPLVSSLYDIAATWSDLR